MKNKSLVFGTIALLLTAIVFLGCPTETDPEKETVEKEVPGKFEKELDAYGWSTLVTYTPGENGRPTWSGATAVSANKDVSSNKDIKIVYGDDEADVTWVGSNLSAATPTELLTSINTAAATLGITATWSGASKLVLTADDPAPSDKEITIDGDADGVALFDDGSDDKTITGGVKDKYVIAVYRTKNSDDPTNATVSVSGITFTDPEIGTVAVGATAGDIATLIAAVLTDTNSGSAFTDAGYDEGADSSNEVTIEALAVGPPADSFTISVVVGLD
ncbi:hypothetical protein FACS1894110_20880 [Spirochaetia bacterium]|nr:hypothetical protein FACS1894110_20880 [Spirochaetia bacterium]